MFAYVIFVQNTRNISRGIRLCQYNVETREDFDAIGWQYLSSSLSHTSNSSIVPPVWPHVSDPRATPRAIPFHPVLSRKSRRQCTANRVTETWSLPMSKLSPLFTYSFFSFTPTQLLLPASGLAFHFFSYNAYVKSRYKFHSRRAGQVRAGGLVVAHLCAYTFVVDNVDSSWRIRLITLWTVIAIFLSFRIEFLRILVNKRMKRILIRRVNSFMCKCFIKIEKKVG